ncbi:substrate-binding domain-containing protein [Limnoglobus roseus]|uniref:Xylose operon regulatory protein n=1 Tax=Limnoglobus roseus TaxID=2598579 RepID=A0A5C1AMY4_9BACT|nr:substrate-binding domain-containing protein [Limnoglobus roseus]QEL20779.1 Xylose operon regulatory protein [Limnoglobus roseus]
MARKPRRVALMLDLRWPYKRHAEVFAGVMRYAEERGWVAIIDEFAHDTLRRRGAADRYDGIVARANHPLARRAAGRGVPVVNVWPSSPARRLLPGVFPDSAEVGRLVAEHLLARGFRSFATVTSRKNADNELEVKEFARSVGAAGFACASAHVPQDPHRDLAHWRTTERLIARAMAGWAPPVGVYVGQEDCGRLVVQAAHRRGWRSPDDVAIVAGKNQEALCERPRPSLTSVEVGYDRIGYAAAELLDRLMTGQPPPSEPLRLAPRGLVVRESTDFFAVNDAVVAAALAYIAGHSHRRSARTPSPVRSGPKPARSRTTSGRPSSARSRPRSAGSGSSGPSANWPTATGRSPRSPATSASVPSSGSTRCFAANSVRALMSTASTAEWAASESDVC